MRGQGRVYRPHGSRIWHLDYSVHGQRHRESSETAVKRDALELLRQRTGDRRSGRLTGSPDKVTLADLRGLVERQYALDGRRSLPRVQQAFAHLERFLGGAARAFDLTPARLDAYAAHRLAAGAARQTVNTELSALRRGFHLALEKGLLATMPPIRLPKVRNTRTGFFEPGGFAALLLELPAYLRAPIRFLHLTGWRAREAFTLTWERVDWEGQVIRLAADETKGGDARLFPFGCAPELKELLEVQWAKRRRLFVFHRDGQPIRSYRRAWASACRRAGLAGRLVHDLRRSAARDLRRAGVSEGEIMRLCGWKTRAMFDRYNIIDEQDLAQAVAKRFANGTEVAQLEGAAAAGRVLSSSAATRPL